MLFRSSKYKLTEVYARHWEVFAQEAGLAKPLAKKRIREFAKSLPEVARQLYSNPAKGFNQHKIIERIIALIEKRCALTLDRLTVDGAQE